MATKATTATTKSEDLLAQILGGTTSATAQLEKTQNSFDLSSVIEQANSLMTEKVEGGKAKATEKAIQQAAAIKAANMDSVRGTLQEQEISLRTITAKLALTIGAIDAEVKALKEPTAEEIKKIQNAEAAVRQCQADLSAAGDKFVLTRSGAVKRAQAALNAAQSNLARIKAAVNEAVKVRMEHASIDDSVANFMKISARTSEVMGKGAITMDQQAKLAGMTLAKSGQAKITLTAALTDYDKKIQDQEMAILNGREALASLVSGTPDYAQQEQAVRDLENQLVELRGQRNVIFIVLGEKEKDIVNFKLLQEACMNMRATYLSWKASLEASSASNAIGWRTAIEVMRASQSQESASDVSRAADSITQDLTASVAACNVATQRLIIDKANSMPIVLQALFTISDTHHEQMEQERAKIEELMEQCKQNWPQIERLNFAGDASR